MENNPKNSPKSVEARRQDRKIRAQKRRVFKAFYSEPKTMLMVSIETGVPRANICRYVAEFEKQERIGLVKLYRCPISRYSGVQYLTTNPDLFLESNLSNDSEV